MKNENDYFSNNPGRPERDESERYITESGSSRNAQDTRQGKLTANTFEDTGTDRPANYFDDENSQEKI